MAGMSRISRQVIKCFKSSLIAGENTIRPRNFNTVRHFSVSKGRNMKFVQFKYSDKPDEVRVGYVEGDNVVDLNKADCSLSPNLLGILRNNELDKVAKIKSMDPPKVPLSSVTLTAPLNGMDKVICIGLNYKDHCEEQNLTPPEVPMFFSKFASTVIGPDQPVRLRTEVTKCVDFEVELTLVIKKVASNVMAHQAHDYIFGYTVAQDISARDWQKQRNGGQFLLGKSMDTFCPIGPWIVTSDEVGDAGNLDISCSLNGELMQNSNTSQLINKIPDVIQRLTSVMTLLPGDIILTGTPGGVGMYRNPPRYLRPGDVLESSVQRIGALVTRVTDCSC